MSATNQGTYSIVHIINRHGCLDANLHPRSRQLRRSGTYATFRQLRLQSRRGYIRQLTVSWSHIGGNEDSTSGTWQVQEEGGGSSIPVTPPSSGQSCTRSIQRPTFPRADTKPGFINRSVRTYWLSGGPRISGTLQVGATDRYMVRDSFGDAKASKFGVEPNSRALLTLDESQTQGVTNPRITHPRLYTSPLLAS